MKANRKFFSSDSGKGLPAISLSFGLGSNKSTWLVPPERKKKMQFFALGAKCGGLDARGSMIAEGLAATETSRDNSEAKARPPMPPAALVRNSRRVRCRYSS